MMDSFNMEMIRSLSVSWGLKLVAALAILFIGRWISLRLVKLLSRLLERHDVDITLVRFLHNVIYYILLTLVFVAAAGQLGINTNSFLTLIGAAGLAVGLALKDSLGNFASGIMLILFRPFKVGDVITAAGETGVVQEITVFNTILTTGDNQRKIIPNGNITNATITNINAHERRRIDLVVGIGYDDDLKQAREILTEICSEETKILSEPAPQVAVSELGDSSVNLVVRPWVQTPDYWEVRFALIERIKTRFDEAGISIPYPQRDVHLHQVSS